ncbi:MAG: hypothetical protein ACRDL5_04635 [Solirubrobacteraceae bacterium]
MASAASRTGVNPLASAADLVGDAPELARRAVETGRNDPRYRYEKRQREARADDRSLPEGRIRFGFEALVGQPRSFTATIRLGDAVPEEAAQPREDVVLEHVELRFSDTTDGKTERERVRAELAAGRIVEVLCNAEVGLDAGSLPDRFMALADRGGIARTGEVQLGLSDPLSLEIAMDGEAGPTPKARLAMYRIPSDPGFSVSYGGTFHGALVFLDVNPDAPRPDGDAGSWTDTAIALSIDPSGVPATELLTGLGFIMAFARADRLSLACAGVLPPGGMDVDITDHGIDDTNAEIFEHAIHVAAVLADLTRLDGRERVLGPVATEYDRRVAELVGELLRHGEIRTPLAGPYRYSIPKELAARDPAELLRGVQRPLGRLAGEPTVVAELRVVGDADGRLLEVDGIPVVEASPREGGRAEVVLLLVAPVGRRQRRWA